MLRRLLDWLRAGVEFDPNTLEWTPRWVTLAALLISGLGQLCWLIIQVSLITLTVMFLARSC